MQKRFASKAAAGKTKNGRDSKPKYLGLKKASGEFVKRGHILIRQRGTKFHPGDNVGLGKDHTLFALEPGYMVFAKEVYPADMSKQPKGRCLYRQYVHVVADNPNVHVKQDIR